MQTSNYSKLCMKIGHLRHQTTTLAASSSVEVAWLPVATARKLTLMQPASPCIVASICCVTLQIRELRAAKSDFLGDYSFRMEPRMCCGRVICHAGVDAHFVCCSLVWHAWTNHCIYLGKQRAVTNHAALTPKTHSSSVASKNGTIQR